MASGMPQGSVWVVGEERTGPRLYDITPRDIARFTTDGSPMLPVQSHAISFKRIYANNDNIAAIAEYSEDRVIVFDAHNGTILQEIMPTPGDEVELVAISRDSHYIAVTYSGLWFFYYYFTPQNNSRNSSRSDNIV